MHIPRVYREPIGGPLRWQDDVSGVLPAAMIAFVKYGADRNAPAPTAEQLELVRDYFDYYVNAPCWATETMEAQFAELRATIKTAKTVAKLDGWLHEALRAGIDPI